MSDGPIEILERWERFGGTWKIRSLSVDGAEVDLCTCDGEPVDLLSSSERRFLELLDSRAHPPPERRA
jgi:hypothetical protein